MKISIAMATYNGGKYIREQLESFAKQTIPPDEVIITDDCSSDDTLKIIEAFQKTAPFDTVVHRNDINLGYTQNFNKALELCSGELVFLSDQDDVWLPNKLEYMLDLATHYKEKDLFMVDAELVDEFLKPSGITKQEQIRNLGLDDKAFVMGCCIAVRKSFLEVILPIPVEFKGHDNWLVALADMMNLRMIDHTILQLYRRHEANTSISVYNELTKKTYNRVHKIIKKIVDWCIFTMFKNRKICVIEGILNRKKLLLVGIKKLEGYRGVYNLPSASLEEDIKVFETRLDILNTKDFRLRFFKAWQLYSTTRYQIRTLLSDII